MVDHMQVELNSSSALLKLTQGKIIELEFIDILKVELELDVSLPYSNLNSSSSLIKSNRVKSNSIESI